MAEKDIGAQETDKDKAKDENKEKEKDGGVINAVYKVNLHCPQCGREIKKPLMVTPGVHNVEVDMEKGEIKVKGVFDPVKIQKRLEKLCKKKIELVSPKIQIKETPVIEKKIVKETKEPISRTILMKVHMHCDKCAQDLEKKLIKRKDIHNVKTDMKAQTLAVEGTIEPEKLLSYLRKKVHKHAEIVPPKPEKKEETKEKEKGDPKPEKKEETKEKEKGDPKPAEKNEETKEKEKGDPKPAEKKEETKEKKEETKEQEKGDSKPAEKKEETKEKEKGALKPAEKQEEKKEKDSGEKSSESITKVVEANEDMKLVEVKPKESNAPYFIHYVYAPQTFSDENPNACLIM